MNEKKIQFGHKIGRRGARRGRAALDTRSAGPPGDLHWEYESLVQAQAELEASRDRYADLYDSAPVGYLTLSRSGCVREINLTGVRFLNMSREHLIGRPLLVYIAKFDRKRYLQHLARCRRDNAERHVELSFARKGGEPPVFVELVSLPTISPETAEVLFESVLIDITARKRAEEGLRQAHAELGQRVAERTAELTRANEALVESEKDMNDFFEQSPLGLIWVAPDGEIQRVNRAQLDLLAVPLERCVGRSIGEFLVDAAAGLAALRRLAGGETLQNNRAQFRREDGSVRHVLVDANGLREKGRLVYSRWFVRDTTQRVELEKEILAISEREQQRIGQDLHDGLCQQLTGIKFRVRLLEEKLARRRIGEHREAHIVEKMLNQAIEQARGQAHGLNPVRLEFGGLTTALRELAASVAEVFHIECSCSPAKPPEVRDLEVAIHFYRIAQEAISNAIKHGKAGKVDIRLAKDNRGLQLAIEDNGVGMPAARKEKGGMGLHIMNYRARTIGAALEVRNGEKGGTVVTCTLPSAPA